MNSIALMCLFGIGVPIAIVLSIRFFLKRSTGHGADVPTPTERLLAESETGVRELSEKIAAQQAMIEALRKMLAEAKYWLELETKRGDGNFLAVERIEKEKNEWKEYYFTAGTSHSVAQDMLSREIERLSRLAMLLLTTLEDYRAAEAAYQVDASPEARQKREALLGRIDELCAKKAGVTPGKHLFDLVQRFRTEHVDARAEKARALEEKLGPVPVPPGLASTKQA